MRRDSVGTYARIALLTVVALMALSIIAVIALSFAAMDPVAAQEAGNETGEGGPSSIEYELDDVDIVNVEFGDDNQTVVIDAYFHNRATVAVTDSAEIDGLGSNDGTGVGFETYTQSPGEQTIEMRLGDHGDELVTIQQGDEMYSASGERDVVDILTNNPTTAVVQSTALGTLIGVILSGASTAGIIKRREHNNYTELLSEERIRVEEDPVEGVVGRIVRFARRHKYALLLAALIVAYLLAVRLGILPSPTAAWGRLNDVQRVFVTGVVAGFVGGFFPMFVIESRLWDPAREFVFDVDARDVIDSALGSKGGLAALEDVENADDVEDAVEELEADDITVAAVYSGSPERVAQMRVDGEPAEIQTPGGRGHLVQDFDPAENSAEGTWPGLADDFELARERSKIDGNREILEDYATVGRRIIGALPAIRAGADTAAVTAVDRKFAEAVSIDSDPVDDIMDSAVAGTRFERYYSKDDGGERDDEYDNDNNEVVNDDDSGKNDGDNE